MTLRRAIASGFMVLVIGVLTGCDSCLPCPPKDTLYVVIVPTGQNDKCTVIPYRRETRDGIRSVTFVNLSGQSGVEIVLPANIVLPGQPNTATLNHDEAATFILKPDLPQDPSIEYEYQVNHKCYEPPPAGPKVIIPIGG